MEETREVIKDLLLKKKTGILEFRSYHGKTTHKRKIYPKVDRTTGWYLGVEKIDQSMRDGKNAYVDPEDPNNTLGSYEIEHLKRLDLAIPENRLILKWLLECANSLALTYEEGKNNPKVTFYVYNKETDTQKRVSKLELKDQAISELSKIASGDLPMIARLLGYKMDKKTPDDIRLFIRELFEQNNWYGSVKNFIEKLNDPDKAVKTFLLRCMDRGVVKKSDRDEYTWREQFMGASFSSTLAWLLDPKNRDLVGEIQMEMGEPVPGLSGTAQKKTTQRKTK